MGGYGQIESRGLQHTIRCETNPAGDVDIDHQIDDYPCSGTRIIIHGDHEDITLEGWVCDFHLCNPFVQISYFFSSNNTGSDDESKPVVLYKSAGKLKKIKTSDPTSIHWYNLDNFKALVYLQADKENIPLGRFIGTFDGLRMSKKRKIIAEGLPDLLAILKDDQLCAELLSSMKDNAREIKPKALGLIGKAALEDTLQPIRSWYKKTCGVHDGKPWAFEIMVAEGNITGLGTAVNHSITFSDFFSDSELVDDWLYTHGMHGAIRRAGAEGFAVFIYFIGISPEFASLGKDRINFPSEIKTAIVRQIRLALTPLHKEKKKRDRETWTGDRQSADGLKKVNIAQREMILEILPEAICKETDNRTLSSNKRNLFYKARPMWKKKWPGTKISYPYF
jgi:hypothetical protein